MSLNNAGSRGKFSQLLKVPKKEIETSKDEEEKSSSILQLKKENWEKDSIIKNLKNQVREFEIERLDLLDERAKLAKLYDMGLIDSAGDPILVEPPEYDSKAKDELMKF